MAKNDHWFKLYYLKLLVSTQGWKDDEFGAYVRLLIAQFDKNGLPEKPEELSKLITSFKKNWPLLSKKFIKDDDGLLRNPFMKEIRAERDKKSVVNSGNGKTGGRGNKKPTETETKAKGLKNESNALSSSFSNSDSTEGEGGSGEEEEIGLSASGFFSDTLDKAVVLTDQEIDNTIEYLRLTAKKVVDRREVVERWEAFKIRQFALHEWYNSRERLINHFRDSLKLELQSGKQQSKSGKDSTGRATVTTGATTAGQF